MDKPSRQALQRCLHQIEQQLGWGSVETWSGADFEALSDRILAATGVRLSPTTLKRVWGRIRYAGSPSPTTLDTLAAFAGYDNWRSLPATAQPLPASTDSAPSAPLRTDSRFRLHPGFWLVGAAGIAAVLALVLIGAHDSTPPPLDPADFRFATRPVARGIPNSVVFDYDATAAPTDSVYIQQSWDARRRTPVSRTGRHHTAMYYEPGFFLAKLVVGSQVVRETPLFIPSEAWVVTAYPAGSDIPVYFNPDSLQTADAEWSLTPERLRRSGVELQPYLPRVRFSYVDTFERWTSHHLDLSAEFRHSLFGGAAVCQYTRLIVLLENDAIIVPLSQPGCVAELALYAPGVRRSGAGADLSAFGTDLREWTHLALHSREGHLQIHLNNKTVFADSLTGPPKPLVGLRLEFTGTGAIRTLRLGEEELRNGQRIE